MTTLTLGTVHDACRNRDARAVASELSLGRAVFVGIVPDEGNTDRPWAFRTGESSPVLPPARDGAGLFPSTLVWRLTRTRPGLTEQEQLLVGRSRSNDVVIEHSMVSKLHARIVMEDPDFLIQDAGSSNGTMLNGNPVPTDRGLPLRNGDQVLFGTVALTYFTTPALFDLLRKRPKLDGR